jgi:hypothetical protein
MNRTEPGLAAHLAGELFDQMVVPLAQARRASGSQPYFPTGPDANAGSYFVAPGTRKMHESDFELFGDDTSRDFIEALAAYWTASGETELAAMAPRMKQIAQAVINEAVESDGNVDVLCYTLF